jgi:NADH:ubiquinone oxidoreductase subunit F (NADH-binding)
MSFVQRVLSPEPVASLEEYVEHHGGGRGLNAAREMGPERVIATIEAAGLRGRGGAGFPTGTKWRTVRENRSDAIPSSVVVNGAEGEPGTFKDRAILRANPYHVLEGALVAAISIGADHVIVGLKRSFEREAARVQAAIDELTAAGWADDVKLELFLGPDEYLYGEETALLETLDGRPPFPRIAPPFRRGVDEVVESAADVGTGSGLSAHVETAGASATQDAPPALVDNVETLANVPKILDRGPEWFRTAGTDASPGTIVCTITGQVQHPGVGELDMGTTLREAVELIGGGAIGDHRIVALVPGVSNAFIPVDLLDTPMTYEDMAAVGSGLGSAGFIVLDETTDPVAAAAGVLRFLSIESCGQCTPCKQDGLALADLLRKVSLGEAEQADLDEIRSRADTVADGARCSIGTQQQAVVLGLIERFGGMRAGGASLEPMDVAELQELSETEVTIDARHATKQPDWTYDETWSGQSPVDRLTDHRSTETLEG